MNKNIKTSLIIGGIVIAIFIIVPLVFGQIWGGQYGGWGMMEPGIIGGFGWMWLMPIFMIVFWGLVIWGIVALVRGLSGSRGSDSSKANSALEILKRRYAEGEIDKKEYEEKKKDLV